MLTVQSRKKEIVKVQGRQFPFKQETKKIEESLPLAFCLLDLSQMAIQSYAQERLGIVLNQVATSPANSVLP